MTGRPACECHGVVMYPSGSTFQCAVRKRELMRARHQRLTDQERVRRRAQQVDRWHAPEGGYVKRRRRHLAAQRQDILARIDSLREEAERC